MGCALNIDLYPFQVDGVNWVSRRIGEGFYWTPVFMETGTGKTPVAFKVIEEWISLGRRKFVVVCPMNVVGNWVDEAAKFHVPLVVQRVHSKQSAYSREQLMLSSRWDLLIINYDTMRNLKRVLIDIPIDGIIFDEVQRLKNKQAGQTQAAREIVLAHKRQGMGRLGLSGTPAPKSPLDHWSIFDVLDPYPDATNYKHHPLGYGSYRSFEQNICTKEAHPRLKGVYKYFFPPLMIAELQRRIQFHAFEAFKEDVLPWLPDQRFQKVYVDMTPEQEKLYNLVRDEAVATLKGAEFDRRDLALADIMPLAQWMEEAAEARDLAIKAGKKPRDLMAELQQGLVSATMQTVVLIRLHQIACGHVTLADGKTRMFGGGKIDYITEELSKWTDEFLDNKVIIFTAFRADVKQLVEVCEKQNIGFVTLTGDNSSEAQEAVNSFQKDPKVRVFICNLAAGSSGITLTAANRVCWYSSTYNWEHRRQSMDRPHRIGQTRPVLYTDLMIRNSMEQYVLRNLEEKKTLARMTTSKFMSIL